MVAIINRVFLALLLTLPGYLHAEEGNKAQKMESPAALNSVVGLKAGGRCATGFVLGDGLIVTAAHFVMNSCQGGICRAAVRVTPKIPAIDPVDLEQPEVWPGLENSPSDLRVLQLLGGADLALLQVEGEETAAISDLTTPSNTDEDISVSKLGTIGFVGCRNFKLLLGEGSLAGPIIASNLAVEPGFSGAPIFRLPAESSSRDILSLDLRNVVGVVTEIAAPFYSEQLSSNSTPTVLSSSVVPLPFSTASDAQVSDFSTHTHNLEQDARFWLTLYRTTVLRIERQPWKALAGIDLLRRFYNLQKGAIFSAQLQQLTASQLQDLKSHLEIRDLPKALTNFTKSAPPSALDLVILIVTLESTLRYQSQIAAHTQEELQELPSEAQAVLTEFSQDGNLRGSTRAVTIYGLLLLAIFLGVFASWLWSVVYMARQLAGSFWTRFARSVTIALILWPVGFCVWILVKRRKN